MPICKAILKYGLSSFDLEILEYCKAEVRFEREEFFLKLLRPEYNIILDVAPFSAETILVVAIIWVCLVIYELMK